MKYVPIITCISILFTGLPNALGDYDETPEFTASQLEVGNVLQPNPILIPITFELHVYT